MTTWCQVVSMALVLAPHVRALLIMLCAAPGGPGLWHDPALPAPRRLDVWEEEPSIEWVEGEPSRFSGAASPTMRCERIGGQLVVITGNNNDVAACACCGSGKLVLLKCSRCRRIKYCDATCQKAHWRVHKGDCQDFTL